MTPRDSTATFHDNLSHLERLNSSSLPATTKPRIGSTANRAPMGFLPPTTSFNKSSDLHWAYLTQLCYAFRLSQPLDVLFRLRLPGLVSCQIRPWGWGSQSFPPSSSRRGFHRALPPAFYDARCQLNDSPLRRTAPSSTTCATLRRCSEEHHLLAAQLTRSFHLRKGSNHARPNERSAQGLRHLEGPFTLERCYPTSNGRSSHNLCCPLRGFLPSSLGLANICLASSHGLCHNAGQVHRCVRSPKCQRARR
jgi:hypothetical protein